jgi:hypothetical protein
MQNDRFFKQQMTALGVDHQSAALVDVGNQSFSDGASGDNRANDIVRIKMNC